MPPQSVRRICAARQPIDRTLQIGALVFQRLEVSLFELGQPTGGAAQRRLGVDGADGEFAPASPSTRSEDGSSVSGKSFNTAEWSPAGRSSVITRVMLAPSG